jgi:hypothetical protein
MSDTNHTSHDEVKEIVHEELRPITRDITQMRNWAISLMSAIVIGLFAYGVWVGTIEQRVTNVERNFDVFEQRLESWLIRIEDKIDRLNTQ